MRSDDDEDWEQPEALTGGEDPLIYLSLGSLGSADVNLMRKLVACWQTAPTG